MRTPTERGILANYASTAWVAIIQVAFIPFYIRYLGVESYGLIGVYATLQTVLSVLDLGMTPTVSREMARFRAGALSLADSRTLLRTLELIFVVTACAIAASTGFLAGTVASHWFKLEQVTPAVATHAVRMMGVIIALRWLTELYRGALMGLQSQVWLSAENAAFATIRSVGVIAALQLVGASVRVFFAFQAVVTLVEVLVMSWKAWTLLAYRERPTAGLDSLTRVWRFSAGMAAITAFSMLLMQLDKVLLSRLLPLKEFGYYSVASAVAGGISYLALPVFNVAFPRLTELATLGDPDPLRASYHRFSQVLSITLIPAAAILVLFAPEILMLWTGDQGISRAASPLLSVLAVGCMLNGLMYTPYCLQLAHGWTRLMVIVNGIAVLVAIPALWAGISRYGSMGAAAFWLALNAMYICVVVPLTHHRLLKGDLGTWYLRDVAAPLVGALAAAAALHLFLPQALLTQRATGIPLTAAAFAAALACASLACPVGREILVRIGGGRWMTA